MVRAASMTDCRLYKKYICTLHFSIDTHLHIQVSTYSCTPWSRWPDWAVTYTGHCSCKAVSYMGLLPHTCTHWTLLGRSRCTGWPRQYMTPGGGTAGWHSHLCWPHTVHLNNPNCTNTQTCKYVINVIALNCTLHNKWIWNRRVHG